MVRDAVAHRFDEDRFSAVFERHATSLLRDFAHSKNIITINANSVDTVSYAAASDAITTVLLDGGGGDGEAVVAADEDDWTGARGGYVEGGVEVTFASGTFAEVAGYNSLGDGGVLKGLEFEGVGCAGGLGNLCAEGGGDGVLN